ncbi:hypothetical protein [Neorhizobium galegae]|uniref:hypothetical protein n=1 Tax=Neorhizobium galegae TaxID=399 RepID=UPI000621AA4F|nr:hypothetical protein [Neorhizobium galegae]CDZ50409.1 Hypothetical protein NGAL_HAMBI2427_36270 [Neorhizobium galegae bv. orientalis]
MAVDIIQFARTFAREMPRVMMVQGLPCVHPTDLEPMIRRVSFKHGFDNHVWLSNRLELHYSKMAVGPRSDRAPRKFV